MHLTELSTVFLPSYDSVSGQKTFSLSHGVLKTIAYDREYKIIYGVGELKMMFVARWQIVKTSEATKQTKDQNDNKEQTNQNKNNSNKTGGGGWG